MVALAIAPGARAMSANLPTPSGVVNAPRPPAQRLTSQAETSASNALPHAIAAEVASEPAVSALAAKAPTKIAGQMRYPQRRVTAIAKPVGGQTGVALGWIEASVRPALARMK